jgi:hypothetical protein
VSERAEHKLAGPGRTWESPVPQTETELLRQFTGRLDPIALGGALAIVCGALLFLATNVLVIKGGPNVGSHLQLLSQYLPGYRVTPLGSVVGGLYAGGSAFLFGWLTAHLRNALLSTYMGLVRLWVNFFDTHFLDRVD